MKRRETELLVGVLGAAVLGCSAQATPDYRGEPLATLRGELTAAGEVELPETAGMQVGVLWLGGNTWDVPVVGESAEAEGEFPLGFQLELFASPSLPRPPPPCETGTHCNSDSEEYIGAVAAFAAGADLERLQPFDILGVSLTRAVLYFTRDAVGTRDNDLLASAAAIYNVPATRGYHLFNIQRDQAAYEAVRRCEANGLCVDVAGPQSPFQQEANEHRFAECLALNPGAQTCSSFVNDFCWREPEGIVCRSHVDENWREPTPEEHAESERCDALTSATPVAECPDVTNPYSYPVNAEGFDARIQIQLGANLYDWLN